MDAALDTVTCDMPPAATCRHVTFLHLEPQLCSTASSVVVARRIRVADGFPQVEAVA